MNLWQKKEIGLNTFREIFNNTPIALYLWQLYKGDLVLIDYNQVAGKKFNFTLNFDLGIKASLIKNKHPDICKNLYQCINNHENICAKCEYYSKKEKNHLNTNFNFIPPNLVLVSVKTPHKKEIQLKESELEYQNAFDRVKFYNDLITHKFNNILNCISLSTLLANDNRKDSKHLIKYFNVINENINRAKLFISNIRKFVSIEEQEMSLECIDLYPILTETIQNIKTNFYYKHIKIKTELQDDDYIIKANSLLNDIFENILVNAIFHNRNPKKEIMIRLTKQKIENTSYIKLEFLDNGIGIPDDKKRRIFKERFENKKRTKGMGFGLTLVNKIIKSYNGKIWVENRVIKDFTKGSKIIILLPLEN